MRLPSLTALCIATLVGASALAPTAAYADEKACPAPDCEQIELGKRVYRQQRCQVCHSIDGVGSRRSPLDGVGNRLDAEQIRRWIVAPKEMDPKVRKRAYDKLPQEELDALVRYMMSLQ